MRWSVLILAGAMLAHDSVLPADAAPDVTLWVVQPPGELVAFNPSDFSRIGGLRIPAESFREPRRLSVNGSGRILARLDDCRLWIWDGEHAGQFDGDSALAAALPQPQGLPEATHTWLLGGGDHEVLALVNQPTHGFESWADTVSTWVSIERLGFSGAHIGTLFRELFAPCLRGIFAVAAVEQCPGPELWAPQLVANGNLILTTWWQEEPPVYEGGELAGMPIASAKAFLFRRRAQAWTRTEIAAVSPRYDLRIDGPRWVATDEDHGCCGWSNDASERAWVEDPDTTIVFYDEWSRFGNSDYDVSFFVVDARLSPSGRRVACTLGATERPDADIRTSAEGHSDSLELVSIRRSLSQMPMVEVHDLEPTLTRRLEIDGAELVGWLGEEEILVVRKRRLFAVDVSASRWRDTGIMVRTPEDAILAWRRP